MHDRPHSSGVARPEFTHGAKVAQGRAGPIHREAAGRDSFERLRRFGSTANQIDRPVFLR